MDEAQASDPGRRDRRTSQPSPTKAVTGGEGRARRRAGGWRAARWARRAVQIACFAAFVYLLFAGLQAGEQQVDERREAGDLDGAPRPAGGSPAARPAPCPTLAAGHGLRRRRLTRAAVAPARVAGLCLVHPSHGTAPRARVGGGGKQWRGGYASERCGTTAGEHDDPHRSTTGQVTEGSCASLVVGPPASYYDSRPKVVGPSLVPSSRGKIRCKVSREIRRLR